MIIVALIFIALFGIIALLFIIALFMRKDYNIHREIIINAPKQKVYDYLKHLKNQDNFNKWVMTDPSMKRDFKGTDGTVGFIYGWNGNKKAGEGELEITALEEGKRIETEIRFIRPFAGLSHASTVITAVSADQTKIVWGNKSFMKYPLNLMLSMIEKMLAKDMDISLQNLKNILEK